jgi:GxxExxY protein
LDELIYEAAIGRQLAEEGVRHRAQYPLPLKYKGVKLNCGYRLDVYVECRLAVEVKSVETVHPIHEAQLLTYLRLTGCELGLLINFDVPVLRQGIRRRIWTSPWSDVRKNLDRVCFEAHTKNVCVTRCRCAG